MNLWNCYFDKTKFTNLSTDIFQNPLDKVPNKYLKRFFLISLSLFANWRRRKSTIWKCLHYTLPSDRSMEPGKSMSMMDTFTDFSMVGVYKTRGELKFVHVTSGNLAWRISLPYFSPTADFTTENFHLQNCSPTKFLTTEFFAA